MGEREVLTRLIGERVMRELLVLDDVAYVRFASVYRTFRDIQEFVETLEEPSDSNVISSADSLSVVSDDTSSATSVPPSSFSPDKDFQ
jgi:hypothetical protein